MDMKLIHMMSYCPTRMSYILSACTQVVINLVPICDVLATADIKKDERQAFMSPKGMLVIHIFADLESIFLKKIFENIRL